MKDMPPVTECDVENCFYNRNKLCHAAAINIGGEHPNCDTFVSEPDHTRRNEGSMVGACHVTHCRFNNQMLCQASSIHVAPHSGHADCATFEQA
jgi:hypothetical protein